MVTLYDDSDYNYLRDVKPLLAEVDMDEFSWFGKMIAAIKYKHKLVYSTTDDLFEYKNSIYYIMKWCKDKNIDVIYNYRGMDGRNAVFDLFFAKEEEAIQFKLERL